MPSASSIRADTSKVSFLFKGPFGFGKTLAAASFALKGKVYLSYWDKKSPIELATFFTKARFGADADTILNNITYDVYNSSNAGEYLNKLLDIRDKCMYFAIINDSLTFMTSGAVNWSLNYGKTSLKIKQADDITPDWDEYKVETSLISQCLDISQTLPCHVIWTAHPIPTNKIEGSGKQIRVTKTSSLVAYGNKVAGLIPGGFSEIYHFSQDHAWGANGQTSKRYICATDAIGDDFAKSPLFSGAVKEIDFTDKLFYNVWKEQVDKIYSAESQAAKSTIEMPDFAKPKVTGW